MRRLATLLLGTTVLLSGCTGASGITAGDTAGSYQFGRLATGPDGLIAAADRHPAPPVAGQSLTGQPLSVADMRGDVVVVNFWADWCGPCRAEAPNLNEVATQTKAAGVRFVGVNVKNDRDRAVAFERVAGTPYPSIYDQPGLLLTRFRQVVPQTPPSTLLIDRQGRLAGIFYGGLTVEELLPAVQTLARQT